MKDKEIVYWKKRNGELISVDDMDINHLCNALKLIIKNKNRLKVALNEKLEKERHIKAADKFVLHGDMAQVASCNKLTFINLLNTNNVITGDKIKFEGKIGFVEYQFNQQISICVPDKEYPTYSDFKEAVRNSETGWMSCVVNINDANIEKI